MSTFEVKVVKIDSVEHHPDADRLSLVKIAGYVCISAKLEDGSHRYKAGDLVVYIPEAAVLPEWLLKKMGFWKEVENKGTLAGSKGDRVKCVKLRNQFSQGIIYPLKSIE
jgi:RNA ligase (TIGR02306 family)